MAKIKNITANEILDSRGNPTVFVNVETEDGFIGSASVPSGASTGTHEALELRDGDQNRYKGLGVLTAVENVNQKIGPALNGYEITNQALIDQKMIELDGSENKSQLGANAILGVSLAVARTAALSLDLPLYKYLKGLYDSKGQWQESLISIASFERVTPFMNILNGGKHADNNIDIQETMVVPHGKTFAESLRMGTEVYETLKKILSQNGLSTSIGDEGGFAPQLESNSQAIELVTEAIRESGYEPTKDISIAIDMAASEFYRVEDGGKYVLKNDNNVLSSHQLIGLYADWQREYPIVSIEDGLSEDDWTGWKDLTERFKETQLVGDDLFVTNKERIIKGIDEQVANSVLIKVNQIGTLSETFEAIRIAKENNYKVMISHRSGETIDSFIADLAVAVSAGQIKAGAPARGERVAKYNRLLEIENELNPKK